MPTNLDAEETVVGANGNLWVAPFGTALPTDIDEALNGAFVDVGFLTEDGAKFTDTKTVKKIPAWQSFYQIRQIVQNREAMIEAGMQQWNEETVPLAFGGGAVVQTTNGYRYNPPDPEELDELSVVLAWADGDKNYRLVVPKCTVEDAVTFTLARSDLALLPIKLGVVGQDGEEPWYLLTDDPQWSTGS
jgi:hypothetical protein